jgi:F0F1-type ATP synthase membrane subunit c/vacuolar-type H+-ATPase subunit K
MATTTFTLPDARDPRAGETALGVALAGVICPVPFVMPAAALRIAADGPTRRARLARRVALATIVAQAAGIVGLVVALVV